MDYEQCCISYIPWQDPLMVCLSLLVSGIRCHDKHATTFSQMPGYVLVGLHQQQTYQQEGSVYTIMIKSVPGTNQYRAMK